MKRASENGLKVTAHFAEVPNEPEVEFLLKNQGDFIPDRFGHVTCIHPDFNGGSEKLWELFKSLKVPSELCLTSNVLCKSVESYDKVRFWCFGCHLKITIFYFIYSTIYKSFTKLSFHLAFVLMTKVPFNVLPATSINELWKSSNWTKSKCLTFP